MQPTNLQRSALKMKQQQIDIDFEEDSEKNPSEPTTLHDLDHGGLWVQIPSGTWILTLEIFI